MGQPAIMSVTDHMHHHHTSQECACSSQAFRCLYPVLRCDWGTTVPCIDSPTKGNISPETSPELQLSQVLLPCLLLQRVVLLSYNADTKRISFRHYSISTAPSGVTKGVKALVAGRGLPNLGEMADVSELLTRSGYGSVISPMLG